MITVKTAKTKRPHSGFLHIDDSTDSTRVHEEQFCQFREQVTKSRGFRSWHRDRKPISD